MTAGDDIVRRAEPDLGRDDVLRHRDQLARELAELQFDLGGLAYEMAVRDHWRIDVLVQVDLADEATKHGADEGELAAIFG